MGQDDREQRDARRQMRRRRKKKAQMIAYSIAGVILVLLGTGIFHGANRFMDYVCIKKEQQEEQPLNETATETQISEPTKEEVEEEEVDALDALADTSIAAMTLEDKVAGLFMVTPEALTGVKTVVQAGDGTKKALEEYPVGGFIYFGQNIVSEKQLKEMMKREAKWPDWEIVP